MDIYTVLLVDDEEEAIQAIMGKINWQGLGFSVAGHAANGAEALEKVEELQPDVVMTDIKLPYMDGFQLSRAVRKEHPTTRILFLTGYDELEYREEAARLEAEAYILKPVSCRELTNVFTQLKIKLDQEISENRNLQALQNYYLERLPFLQADFYCRLVEGRIGEEELSGYLSDYRISFEGPFYCCLVVHTWFPEGPGDAGPLLSASVHRQAREGLGEGWRAKCFTYLGDTVLIAQLNSEGQVPELTDECHRFCRYARRVANALVTVGIGQVCDKILQLSQSYASAREAVACRPVWGPFGAVNLRELSPREMSKMQEYMPRELVQLFRAIGTGAREDVTERVDGYLSHSYLPVCRRQRRMAIMELVSALSRFAAGSDIALEEFSGDMGNLWGRLGDMEPEAFKTWLVHVSLSLRQSLMDARRRTAEFLVSRAKDYVGGHYWDEKLTQERICRVFGLSNASFSTMFKRETGKSFSSYLRDYRMDLASRLLVQTNDKSYLIAKRVGYTDPNYFSYLFKRRFGLSPSKYRMERGEG